MAGMSWKGVRRRPGNLRILASHSLPPKATSWRCLLSASRVANPTPVGLE